MQNPSLDTRIRIWIFPKNRTQVNAKMSFNKLEYASLPCVVRKSWSYKTRKWSLNLHPWNSLLKIRPQIAFSCRVKAALDVVLNSCYSRVYLTQISSKCNLWLSVASLVTFTFVTASAGLVDLAGKKYTFQTRPKSLSFFGSKKVIK